MNKEENKQEPSGWLDEQTGDYSRVNRLGWSALYLHPAPVNQQLLEALRLMVENFCWGDMNDGEHSAITKARAAIAAAEGKV